jgi:hypothetical protein
VLLQACLNGSRRRVEHHALPVMPEDIAEDAARAAVVSAVRSVVAGLPVGGTTGAWALSDAGERLTAVRSWSVLPGLIRLRQG